MDKSVGAAKLADKSVDASKLTDGSVTSAKIADGGVSTADIAPKAVTSDKLADSIAEILSRVSRVRTSYTNTRIYLDVFGKNSSTYFQVKAYTDPGYKAIALSMTVDGVGTGEKVIAVF